MKKAPKGQNKRQNAKSLSKTTQNQILNKKTKRTTKTDIKEKSKLKNQSSNQKDNKMENNEKSLSFNDSNFSNIHYAQSIVNDIRDESLNKFSISRIEVNLFETFKSIDNIYFLVYVNKDNSLVFYNLNDNEKVCLFKKAHKEEIRYIKYYLDIINKRDLLLSSSPYIENNIKIWNIKNYECILSLNVENIIYSSNFLYENNQINIISYNYDYHSYHKLNIFNLDGVQVAQIKYQHGNLLFLKTYFNKKNNKSYIITCHYSYLLSYDYTKGKTYHKYKDVGTTGDKPASAVIIDQDEQIKLIESCLDGNIRIWDFDSAKLLNKINIEYLKELNSICVWENNYIFVGGEKGIIVLIDLKSGKIVKKIEPSTEPCISAKDPNYINWLNEHPKFKEINDINSNDILSIKKTVTNLGDSLFIQKYNDSKINVLII